MRNMEFNIENNKKYFNDQIMMSLRFLSQSFNISLNESLQVDYDWKVFSNYFLCVDAINNRDEILARRYLNSALDNLKKIVSNHKQHLRPAILVINDKNICEDIAITLKEIYDKPDNDVNDDGVYAFGPFVAEQGDLTERGRQLFVSMKEQVEKFLN